MNLHLNTRKLRHESLEERALLAVTAGGFELAAALPEPVSATGWIVNTLEDATNWDTADDILSLREAIGRAQTCDTITFDESLAGGTITLSGTELSIDKGITIDASSIDGITIDADGQSRVFYVSGGDQTNPVQLIGLKITGGVSNADGGGVFNSGILTVANATITGNSANNNGGGIYNSGSLMITNATVSENTAIGSVFAGNTTTGLGGGIYAHLGSLKLTSCTVSRNIGKGSGGGIAADSVSLTLTNSTLSGNSAFNGGGVYYSGNLTLLNCVISGNYANYCGGGIDDTAGTLTITNSTVSGNSADRYGAGVCVHSGSFSLTNSIVSLNYAGYDSNIHGSFEGRNNIIGFDPDFVVAPVFESGKIANLDDLDLSLSSGSWAIDSGDNSLVENEIDLMGNQRIIAALGESAIVDLGAYEYQSLIEIEEPSLVVTTNLDIVNRTDNLISLREAIFYASSGAKITFDPSLMGKKITLSGSQLEISKGLTIDASDIGGITIDANKQSRVFYANDASLDLIGLTIKGGFARTASGIYNNNGTLTMKFCTVRDNDTYDSNSVGGILSIGTATLTNCIFVDNGMNTGNGDGDIRSNGLMNILNCTFENGRNSWRVGNLGGDLNFYNSILCGNGSVVIIHSGRVFAYNTLSTFNHWSYSFNCPTYDWSLPLFADPSHGDYTLAENSQAINRGNNEYVTTETDLAGNPRILNGTVDLGAYEYTGVIEPLDAPSILTGARGVYVSYGANRHQVTWTAVDRAVAYEFAYSLDGGSTWTSLETNDTAAVVRGLSYGTDVFYRVRALSSRYLENSDWSPVKSFLVCPMDVNNDGDIGGLDRNIIGIAWGKEEGEEGYRYYADINGDGDVTGLDRNVLGINWGYESDDPDLLYPRPVAAADMVFAEYASADLDISLDLF